jgi:hypothetical protein
MITQTIDRLRGEDARMLPSRSIAAAMASALALTTFSAVPAVAVDALHHVRYTVTAETPTDADIYYRDTDPPDFAAYSHNPYQFSPKADVMVGPGQTWVLDVILADPDQWAMVAATSRPGPFMPNFHCTLEVDSAIVKTGQGPKGALCSPRPW